MSIKKKAMWNVGLIAALLGLLFLLEQVLPSGSMLFTVLKKGAIYALVAVSMNLLMALRDFSLWARQALCCWGLIPMPF